jgi:hypothetical protein
VQQPEAPVQRPEAASSRPEPWSSRRELGCSRRERGTAAGNAVQQPAPACSRREARYRSQGTRCSHWTHGRVTGPVDPVTGPVDPVTGPGIRFDGRHRRGAGPVDLVTGPAGALPYRAARHWQARRVRWTSLPRVTLPRPCRRPDSRATPTSCPAASPSWRPAAPAARRLQRRRKLLGPPARGARARRTHEALRRAGVVAELTKGVRGHASRPVDARSTPESPTCASSARCRSTRCRSRCRCRRRRHPGGPSR